MLNNFGNYFHNFLKSFFRKKSLPKDLRSKISSEVIKIKTEKGEEEKKAAARRKRENEADQEVLSWNL